MISLLISLFLSMKHTVNDMLQGHGNTNKTIVVKNVASAPKGNSMQPKPNNPITVIKPGTLAAVVESNTKVMAESLKASNLESHVSENKTNSNKDPDTPSDLSQYDDYAKNISDLKRKIELNKLKAEMYKSSIDYEDPGSFGQATMIGVVIDPRGFKAAHIKLADDTTTDLMIGSRFGGYIVTGIDINQITLINAKCKKNKKSHKHTKSRVHSKYNNKMDDDKVVIHTDTENRQSNLVEEENPLICKSVKIYPLYRDINNRLPVNNSNSTTMGPGNTRTYNPGSPSTTNAGLSTNNPMMNAAGAAGSSGTSISSGGMTLTIPPIETGPHGN